MLVQPEWWWRGKSARTRAWAWIYTSRTGPKGKIVWLIFQTFWITSQLLNTIREMYTCSSSNSSHHSTFPSSYTLSKWGYLSSLISIDGLSLWLLFGVILRLLPRVFLLTTCRGFGMNYCIEKFVFLPVLLNCQEGIPLPSFSYLFCKVWLFNAYGNINLWYLNFNFWKWFT